MKRSIYHCFGVLSLGLLFAFVAAAQLPKVDPKTGQRAIVVTDDNFEVEKPAGPVFRRSITCEVWITTDGMLHCKKKGLKLISASVKFTHSTVSSASGGTGTYVGGDFSRKLPVKELVLGQDTYTWDISGDKYREKHSITLIIASALGSGQIILVNKKVPKSVKQ